MNAKARDLMSVFMSAFGTTGATKADLRNVADLKPATFHRSFNELVEAGALIDTGTNARPFYVQGDTQ
jgi:hypothetical protein